MKTAVAALLRQGLDVIVDDTNLPDSVVEDWRRLAAECGATMEVIDLRYVPVEDCVVRDAARGAAGGRQVGSKVIRQMAATQQRVLAPRTGRQHGDADVIDPPKQVAQAEPDQG